ncbi:nuclear transport factor 2 family protein [Hugenholtzia roseola]|uniref:nuclear transport factor 2 family protein n=1 Tax=Hugenholtzia roseola TaxID=1002 RepID=UPI00040DFBCC|nr:nuclear transport factor 2 family protein [Hugenholtzia roseola]
MNQIEIKSQEVVEAENKLFSAQLISDVETLDQLLHDDLLAVTPVGQVVTKKMDLDAHKAKTMTIEEASTQIEDIKIIGDTAISIVMMKAKGKMLGTPTEGTFRYLRVWKRFDNTLKVIAATIIQIPQ